MNSRNVKLKQAEPEISKKKSVDKKKWREQKYSAKAKVNKWENIKRRQTLRQYNKELKKSGITVRNCQEEKNDEKLTKLKQSLKKAQLQYQKIQEEKEQRRKEKEIERQRREAALKAYKEKKAMRHKKLFNKSRGRVSMKGRLELLLEEIMKKHGKNDN